MNLSMIESFARNGYYPVAMVVDVFQEVISEVGYPRLSGAFVKIVVDDDGLDFAWKIPNELEYE